MNRREFKLGDAIFCKQAIFASIGFFTQVDIFFNKKSWKNPTRKFAWCIVARDERVQHYLYLYLYLLTIWIICICICTRTGRGLTRKWVGLSWNGRGFNRYFNKLSVLCVSEQSGTQQHNRGRSHIAPKNAWKTLGALLSPFFPKRSGGCAPEAFVVAKQPSAALSVTRRCGALAAFWKVEMFLSRCGADAPGKNERVASIMSAHILHLK